MKDIPILRRAKMRLKNTEGYYLRDHEKKIPFIFQMGLLYYFRYKLNKRNKKMKEEEKDNKTKVLFKEMLLDAIDFITYRINDEKWLELLHGNLININSALCFHNKFCNKYRNEMEWNIEFYTGTHWVIQRRNEKMIEEI